MVMHGRYMRAPAQEDDRPIRAKTVRRVIGTFRPYRRKVAWVGLAIVVTSGLGVVNPLLIKWIFDNGLFGNPAGSCAGQPCPQLDTVYIGVALMIAIPIVTGVIGVGQTYLANWVGLRVMQDLRNAL
jgi:ATP-binding cassette subfamily B protein